MGDRTDSSLTAKEVLRRYGEEDLPAFVGVTLDDVNATGPFGEHPLDVAAGRGALDEVLALLDGGADINAAGDLGNTALHEAVGQGHVDVVSTLLRRGASRALRNQDGHTALEVAVLRGHADLAELLQGE